MDTETRNRIAGELEQLCPHRGRFTEFENGIILQKICTDAKETETTEKEGYRFYVPDGSKQGWEAQFTFTVWLPIGELQDAKLMLAKGILEYKNYNWQGEKQNWINKND